MGLRLLCFKWSRSTSAGRGSCPPASTSSTTLSEQDGGAVEATTTAIEATDSMVAEATAVTETADATAPEEAPIEEGSIRLHFENVDETAPESQGLWTWGGVAEPSDGNQWPTDTANFSSSQVDDYGHYVDIKNLRHQERLVIWFSRMGKNNRIGPESGATCSGTK